MYPAVLNCTKVGESTVIDGVPQSGVPTELSYPCRYRPNTAAKVVRGIDGQTVVYRGTCYIPKPNTLLAVGDLVTVPGFIDQLPILQVYNAQFRARIIL